MEKEHGMFGRRTSIFDRTFFSLVVFLSFFSRAVQAQWMPTGDAPSEMAVVCMAETNGAFYVGGAYGVFRSTDGGVHWSEMNSGLIKGTWNYAVNDLVVKGEAIYAGLGGNGVYQMSLTDTEWVQSNYGIENVWVNSLAVSGSKMFAGISSKGVYVSTDDGWHWTEANTGLDFMSSVNRLAVNGTSIFAATYTAIFRSTDTGSNWTNVSPELTGFSFSSVSSGDGIIYASTIIGTYRSSNNGDSWTLIYTNEGDFRSGSVIADGNNIFLSVGNKGIIRSIDNGSTWNLIHQGLPNNYYAPFSLMRTATMLYAGFDTRVWKRPLSDFATSVHRTEDGTPEKYSLGQNYPNPFNPSTNIRFTIPEQSEVRLTVRNIIGQQVAEISGAIMEAGTYEQKFTASGSSSGVYFYTITAASLRHTGRIFTETRKMLLVK